MNRPSTLRRAGTVLAALLTSLALVVTAAPAQAGSMFFSKSSGRMATLDWLEVGTLPGVQGNAHLGTLFVEEQSRGGAYVFGYVLDLECPEGVTPGHGGGHGEGEEPSCTEVGFRFIDGGDVTFTMDRKFGKARLTGTLAVSDHGTPLGNPPVDITLTGVGNTYRSTDSGRYSDGTTSYSYRYSFTGRQASVSGRIGVMVFDDEPGEYSNAQMGAFRSASRDRIR